MKKRFFNTVAYILTMALLFAAMPVKVYAAGNLLEKIDEAEKQKQETEKEKQEAIGERDEKQGEINNLQFQKGTLKAQIDNFNDQLETENANLQAILTNISDKNADIDIAKAELEEAQKQADDQYQAMKKRMQSVYEQPSNMYLEMLLSCKDFSTFLNMADYIYMVSEYDNNMYDDYNAATQAVADKKAALETELSELENLEEQNREEQARISDLISTTNKFVEEYTVQIQGANEELAEIEREIEAKEAEIAAQQADIDAMKKQYEEELRLSQLAAQAPKRDISEITFAEGDRFLLASIIYCEAGGEPYEGQLAVGAVVINRVLSSKYPDNVHDVVYAPHQFSPVGSGRLELVMAQNKATASCYKAADEAMAGGTNVGGCLYFRTPIPGLTGIQIGGHIFY